MRKFILITIVLYISYLHSFSQVGINSDQSLPDPSAMLDIKSMTKGFLPPRMTMEQMNAVIAPSIGLLVYNTTMSSYFWFDGNAWISFDTSKKNIHTVGDIFGGGIVFYVYDNGQHGLIAANVDQSFGIQWHNGTDRITGTTGDGLNAGEAWSIYFYDGFQSSYAKNDLANVRPIRSF